jgi:ribonuclease HI
MASTNEIVAYTDGSFRKTGMKNGKLIGKCGYGVHFPNGEYNDISSPFDIGNKTNNRAELYAIYKALKTVEDDKGIDNVKVHIFTDSEYSMKSLTVWIHGWKKKGWKNSKRKTPENTDIIKMIDDEFMLKYADNIKIEWVKAHSTNEYNNKADELANAGADKDI